MALSYFSNSDYLQLLETNVILQDHQKELLADDDGLFGFDYTSPFLDPFIDQLFQPEELFSSHSCDNPNFSSPSYESLSSLEDLESFHFPKCQKCYSNHNFNPQENCFLEYPLAPEIPSFQVQTEFDKESVYQKVNLSPKEPKTVSPQSIAARERRRKITAKTLELARMIPSGEKMNTAEMFQAAAKFVKFLQAQIGILQLMTENHYPCREQEELQVLLLSPAIQEKLATEEKCLVPGKLLGVLASDPEIGAKELIIRDIDKLLHTNA